MINPNPRIPDGLCLYAIGDIHGCKSKLLRLMDMLAADAETHPNEEKRLVFMGDYIDRGPDSRGVVDYLINEVPAGFTPVFLRGNHEDVALRVLGGEASLIPSWMQYGAASFLGSYGVNPFRPKILETPEILQAELADRMSPNHWQFLQNTVPSHNCGDYFFAHAGVKPGVPLDRQDVEDLLWIRHAFLASSADFGKIVIHGHSIEITPSVRPNRIGIDTGAYATGKLTAVKLWRDTRQFFTT